MKEIWKDVEGFEKYEVSNMGNVRNKRTQFVLALRHNHAGYNKVGLCCNGHQRHNKKGVRVARLVAIAFIPNPDNLPEVDHINRVRDDDRVENLRWVTHSENNYNKGPYKRKKH